MREIKFRGFNGEKWVYGDLVHTTHGRTLMWDLKQRLHFNVDPDSVGQFTGIKDISGAEIYEGDIVTFKDDETDEHVRGAVVQSVEGTWWVKCAEFRVPLWNVRKTALILSNIHDVPELLEGENA